MWRVGISKVEFNTRRIPTGLLAQLVSSFSIKSLILRHDGRKIKKFLIERLEQPATSAKIQLKPNQGGKDTVKITLTKKFKLPWKKLVGRKLDVFNPENYKNSEEKKEDSPLENIYGMM